MRNKENKLLPVGKILSTRQDQIKFLGILSEEEGYLSRAAKRFGCSLRTAQYRVSEDKDFKQAVYQVREAFRTKRLEALERVSYEQALDPKATRERLFQLKAGDPQRYRDWGPSAGEDQLLQVVFNYHIPKYDPSLARREEEERLRNAEAIENVEVVEVEEITSISESKLSSVKQLKEIDPGISELNLEDL